VTALIAVLCILGFIVAADVYLVIRGGLPATISWFLWTNSVKYPIIPFVLGVLAGHLFWDQMLTVTVTGGCTK